MSKEQRDSCLGEITEKEFLKSLKSMQNSKSPGKDKYSEDFYGTFWNDAKNLFYEQLKKPMKYND